MWIVNITPGNKAQCSVNMLEVTGSHIIIEVFESTSNTKYQWTNCKFIDNVLKIGVLEGVLGWSFT